MLNFDLVTKSPEFKLDFSKFPDVLDSNKLAHFLCFILVNGFTPQEKQKIFKIIEELIERNDQEINYVLARKLCYLQTLPINIAKRIARLDIKVARKMILHSPVLSNLDFIEILEHRTDIEVYKIIAKRKGIDGAITSQVTEKNIPEAIINMLRNTSAEISVASYKKIIAKYQHNKEVMNLVNNRDDLSPAMVKEILESVDITLRKILVNTYGLDQFNKIPFCRLNVVNTKDRDIFSSGEAQEIKGRIDNLYNKNLLSPPLLIRFLCKGDLFSFIYSLSKISDLPFKNLAENLFYKFDEDFFNQMYGVSCLPENHFEAIKLLVMAIGEMLKCEKLSIEEFPEKIVSYYSSILQTKNVIGAKYLISLILS